MYYDFYLNVNLDPNKTTTPLLDTLEYIINEDAAALPATIPNSTHAFFSLDRRYTFVAEDNTYEPIQSVATLLQDDPDRYHLRILCRVEYEKDDLTTNAIFLFIQFIDWLLAYTDGRSTFIGFYRQSGNLNPILIFNADTAYRYIQTAHPNAEFVYRR